MGKYKQITDQERDKIAVWLASGESIRQIGKKLERSHSSVLREIKRNGWQDGYVAIHAQAEAGKRASKSRQRYPLKNEQVFSYVLAKLRCGWSPEQIAGRLQRDHLRDSFWNIHHETIYRYIYAPENKEKSLWEYLPRKQKKRRKRYGRKARRIRIPDRISIHERPQEIETRFVFGHWEGDSVEGKAHKGGIHTQVERKTRFVLAVILPDLTANETAKAAQKVFVMLPEQAKKSTTLDNGKEFTKHQQFGIPTYFADPYSSWQRGTNENTNGLIRRFLPKKTDLTKVTQQDLDDIIWEINNRPRKCLDFATSSEIFRKEIEG